MYTVVKSIDQSIDQVESFSTFEEAVKGAMEMTIQWSLGKVPIKDIIDVRSCLIEGEEFHIDTRFSVRIRK